MNAMITLPIIMSVRLIMISVRLLVVIAAGIPAPRKCAISQNTGNSNSCIR